MAEQIVLVRHGETEWSRLHQHTGRTDIGLTERGERDAVAVADELQQWSFSHALSSPLLRARETARLAGFGEPELIDDLMEWDYGDDEGRTTVDIRKDRPGFSKWLATPPGGESVADVAVRVDRFIDQIVAREGHAVVFAHGHLLAVLVARWLDLEPVAGRRFPLATASISVLDTYREDRVLRLLNHRCDLN